MPERKVQSTLACLLAVMLAVGFTAAPVAAIDGVSVDDDDEITVDTGDEIDLEDDGGMVGDEEIADDEDSDVEGTVDSETEDNETDEGDGDAPATLSDAPVPAEVCTDVGDEGQSEVEWNELPWFDDLPEEAQPPGVPTNLVTPRAVAAIVFGVTPNQCDVQDPTDPTYDPFADGAEPNASFEDRRLGEYRDGGVVLVFYEATLNESGDGPAVSGKVGTLVTSAAGDLDHEVTINDGEKDYTVDPQVRYWEDGTAYADTDVWALDSRVGVEVDCDGEECQAAYRGLPQEDVPAIPAPTGQDDDDENDEEAGTAPTEDDVDPDADVEVRRLGEYNDGGVALVFYEATLNESGDGPAVSGKVGTLVTPSAGDLDHEVTINDGEKDYTVDPQVRYWEDGSVYADTDVSAFDSRLGGEMDCTGEECQTDYQAPSPDDEEQDDDSDDNSANDDGDDNSSDTNGDDSNSGNDDGSSDPDDSSDSSDNDDTESSSGNAESSGGSDAQTGGDSDDGSDNADDNADDQSDNADDQSDNADDNADDQSDNADDNADDQSDNADDNADDQSSESNDGNDTEDADEPVEPATEDDGPGFGAGLAVLAVLFATLMASRRVS